MTDYEDGSRGAAREWAAARIVLIGGFIVAIAVAGFFVWQRHQSEVQTQQKAVANVNAQAQLLLCAMELASAKHMGIVPSYGRLITAAPRDGGKQGRYVCAAATPSLGYIITADLVCRALTDPKCVKVQSIKTNDGTALFTAPAQ